MPAISEMLSDIERSWDAQFTDDQLAAWLDVRCGKLTASRMADCMAKKKDGGWMKCRSDLMRELLAERLTGLNNRHFVTPAMEWGLQQEPNAKAAFAEQTGLKLAKSWFYEHPVIENFGATPDAEISDDTLVEFKCPTTTKYLEWVMAGVVPDEHKPQLLAQIAATRRGRVIFCAYDPRIKDPARQLFIREFVPKVAEVEAVEAAAAEFLGELDQAWERFVTA